MKISRNPFRTFYANLPVSKRGLVSGTVFVSAENEIIRSLSTSYGMILSVISVFVCSLTNIGHIRPISLRYLRTIGPSDYRAAILYTDGRADTCVYGLSSQLRYRTGPRHGILYLLIPSNTEDRTARSTNSSVL